MSSVRKVRILIISPPALSQVIEYLFRDRPEFEVVGSLSGLRSMGQQVGRLCPDLIVANVKPVRTAVYQVVASIKRSSPSSKLILICPARDFMAVGRRCGADACLEQEKLVRRLLGTALALTECPKSAASRN
jgi:chemotaxis response regulator CheB